jgi:hypothetical protein
LVFCSQRPVDADALFPGHARLLWVARVLLTVVPQSARVLLLLEPGLGMFTGAVPKSDESGARVVGHREDFLPSVCPTIPAAKASSAVRMANRFMNLAENATGIEAPAQRGQRVLDGHPAACASRLTNLIREQRISRVKDSSAALA